MNTTLARQASKFMAAARPCPEAGGLHDASSPGRSRTRRSRSLVQGCLAGVVLCALLLSAAPAWAGSGSPVLRGSHVSLAQAPAGLRAAVRNTLGVSSGTAASVFETAKLAPSDAVAGDQVGSTVAVSGSTAVVGAPAQSSNRGAAYVYVRSGSSWSEQFEVTPHDAASGDYFGYSAAISGSIMVIGAPFKNSGAGAAYVYVRSGGTWSERAELTGAAGSAEFGTSVAIYGQTVVIGAPLEKSGTGAAYVFVNSSSGWLRQARLAGAASGARFGQSVALYGSTAVVGAVGVNSSAGAAYVFVRSGTAWSQQAELTAPDAASGDQFGVSTAIYGQIAVVGAPTKNSFTGAAYVFTRSGSQWSEKAKLTASDVASNDEFGTSVAIYGKTALIGAFNSSGTGAAYVFVQSGPAWAAETKLTASDAASGDQFGHSVAISGSTAVIGAPNQSGTGAAYVFVLPSQQAELMASDRAAGDNFGESVAISGSTAVIGAPQKNSNTGKAYVFVRSGSKWSKQAELTPSDAAPGDAFGWSVSIYGSTTIIGAPGKNSAAGAIYVFVRSGTAWSQQAELAASDATSGDQFGYSVAVSGSTAIVGAPYQNGQTGAAYAFASSGSAWSQQAKLTASDAASAAQFGYSVAIYGQTAVIGAPMTGSAVGTAYVFGRSGSAWSQQAELAAPDGLAGELFGFSVAIYGSTAVIAAPFTNSATGAAFVFAGSGSAWSEQASLVPSDAASEDQVGTSVSISGSTVVLSAPAQNSSTGAGYVFAQSGAGWSQQAKLTASDAAAGDAFGAAVAVDGPTAVFGAPGRKSKAGAAYMFTNL